MRELILSWRGEEYRCQITHDTIMHIENKVMLTEIAQRTMEGSADGNVPTSHIVWVFYCLLRSGGAVVDREELWEMCKRGEIKNDTISEVMGFLIGEVFGVGPEDIESLPETEEGSDGKKSPEENIVSGG